MQPCPLCRSVNQDTARLCSNCGFDLAQPNRLAPGILLDDRYRIVEQIGGGGMSRVYRALDTRLGDAVRAVKEFLTPESLEPRERDRAVTQFRREAEVLARLDHANLPRVYDYSLQAFRSYLVMDYVDGWDLRWVLAHRPETLTKEAVLKHTARLCGVLHYLHSQTPPIIFRDLKPSNIMLTRHPLL
jgi:serine/threonine-protein kinase